MSEKLTPAQERILSAVRRDGKRVYNARARQPVERLEALGLVTVDWDADLDATKGRLRWRITVTAPDDQVCVAADCPTWSREPMHAPHPPGTAPEGLARPWSDEDDREAAEDQARLMARRIAGELPDPVHHGDVFSRIEAAEGSE